MSNQPTFTETTTYMYMRDTEGKLLRLFTTDDTRDLEFKYDAFGNCIEEIHHIKAKTDPSTVKHFTSKYEYDQNNRLIREYDPVSNENYQTFEYDENGNKIRIYENGIGISEFKYDDSNRLIEQIHTYFDGDFNEDKITEKSKKSIMTFEYDENGKLICKTRDNKFNIWYIYNADGLCIEERHNRANGEIHHVYIEYNENKKVIRRNSTYLNTVTDYVYDESNNLIKKIVTETKVIKS